MQLQETYDMLLRFEHCQTEEQVSRVALDLAGAFGAEHYLCGTMPPKNAGPNEQMKHLISGSWPAGWAERYFSRNYLRMDPTIDHVRASNSSLVWGGRQVRRSLVMDEAGDFGLSEGITVPQQSLDGLKIGISFAGQKMCTDDPAARSALTVIGAYTVSSALRVLQRNYRDTQVELTEREREVLYWIAEGKTSWEIGVILSIAKPTVEKHFTTLQSKLNARNRTHAVAEALRRGYLR